MLVCKVGGKGQPEGTPQRQDKVIDMSELQATISQLTAVVTVLAENQQRILSAESPAHPVGPPPDPNYDWNKLVVPAHSHFPPATEGQVRSGNLHLFAITTLTTSSIN